MDTVKERLSFYLLQKGINKSEFGRRIGVSSAFITSMRKSIQPDKIAAIKRNFPDLNTDWLLTGEGDMLKPDSHNEMEEPASEEIEAVRAMADKFVPLIPTPALANSLAEFMGEGIRRGDCQKIQSPVPGAEFAISISGDSMEPKFHNGMIVFLKRIDDAAFIPWGNTLVIDTINGAFIKDVYPIEGDDSVIEARSTNPLYPPLTIPKTAINGMYRILNATKFFTTM